MARSRLVASSRHGSLHRAQEILQLRSGRVEQRPNHVVAPRRHRRQSAAARAARQPQDHGLRLIVARMRDRDAVGLDRRERLLEEALPREASGDFDRDAVRLRRRRHVGIADDRGHAEPIGQRAAERRIGVGIRAANVMVEMREAREDELAARREVAQQEGERDRIRSARHRGDDASFRRPERMPGRETRTRSKRLFNCANC